MKELEVYVSVDIKPVPAQINNFYSGSSGLSMPFGKSDYPIEFKDKSRLEFYASMFNSIEINSIFYKLPRKNTLVNWSNAVPENFRFTLKVPKIITHAKDLNFTVKDVADFMEVANNIGSKKGCLLAQFPPSFKIDKLDRLPYFFEAITEATQNSNWQLVIEFRDCSFYEREVMEILTEYNASMVLHDMEKSASGWEPKNNDFIYLRYHGPEPRYRGSYSDLFLQSQAKNIKKWLQQNKTVYAYFNNTVGDAFQNLQTLNRFVNS